MIFEEVFHTGCRSAPDRLDLHPFMLNGPEVRRIRGRKQESVPCLLKKSFGFGTFVKRGVVHDDNTVFPKRRQQKVLNPSVENRRVHGAVEYGGGDDIAPPLAAVSPQARHVMGKSAFIRINRRPPGIFERLQLLPELLPLLHVRLRMPECFFTSDTQSFECKIHPG
jgi:hypothetical protein